MNRDAEAFERAVSLLARRGYTEKEMQIKLADIGYEREVADWVVKELIRRGYLNDAGLCGALAEKYISSGKLGKNGIIRKLKQRGIPNDIIERELGEYSDKDECRQAQVLIRRRFGNRTIDPLKLARFLAYRGFSRKTVLSILGENLPPEAE